MARLEDVSVEYLRELFEQMDDPDAIKRLSVAIAYKEVDELTQTDAAALYGFSSGWASRWFERLERLDDEPYEDVLYDEPRSGRPPKLSRDQQDRFEAVLREPPQAVGIDGVAWTVKLARQYLQETFDVEYSDRHIRRIMREAGLSCETGRSVRGRTSESDRDGTEKRRPIWTTET
jgi:transposase